MASQPELILELEHFIFSKDFPVAEREGEKGRLCKKTIIHSNITKF